MERGRSGVTANRRGTRIVLALVCLLAVFPVRTLVATALYGMTLRVLDDTTTEGLDAFPVSEESLVSYRTSLSLLSQAARWTRETPPIPGPSRICT